MFRMPSVISPISATILATTLFTAELALAGITTHEPGYYKMAKYENTGEAIPLNGPVIEVFSKDGKKYTSIANDNENLKHVSRVGGICDKRSQKFKTASITVAGESHSVSGTGNHSMKTHTESFEFPFMLPSISRSPAAACNHELDKRVASGNKSRDYWLSRGFVVKYENAYEAKFTASCSGGVSHGDFVSKTIETPVWIACAGTDSGSSPKPNADPKPPKETKLAPLRAKPVPLKVVAKLDADNAGTIYSKECPVRVKYTGSIYVSKPNTKVTYQIAGSDWESPQRTITIAKPGFKDITSWTQYYREKKADINRVTAGNSSGARAADNKGSVRLTVKSGKMTVKSDPIPYEVYCNMEKPMRLKQQ